MTPPEASARAVPYPAAGVPAVEPARPDMRLLSLLALGHMVVDINQGSLAAILPFLKSALNLSYTATGTIVLMANISSSIIQPAFGYLADKTARRWLLPVSVALSSLGLGLTGLSPSYAAVIVLVMITGFGVAAYHPEGYRTATAVAGSRKATGVSVFSTGGNIGIAVGPPLITALLTTFGLAGSLGMLVPGLLVGGLLTLALPLLSAPPPPRARGQVAADPRTMVGAMSLLVFVVAVRSWTQTGFTTYVPFYYLETLGGDPRLVGTLLGVFLGAGVVGTLVAGPIADRVGIRRYVVSVFLLATPVAVSFFFVTSVLGLYVVLAVLGFVMVSTFTVSVVLGQAYLPRNPGMASGLIVGFAIGAGGIGVTVLGWLADHFGLLTALWVSALMPTIGFVGALFLPEPRAR